MRKKLIVLFVFTCLVSNLIWPSSAIFASGDQVKVNNNNGVMYLTTEVENSSGAAVYAVRKNGLNIMPGGLKIPTGFAQDLGSVINSVLSFVMVIATMLVLFYLIMGAFGWITSGGDKAKIQAARSKIIAAVIGLLIVASSYAIFMLMIRFLGFTSLENLFNSTKTMGGKEYYTLEQVMDATASGQTQ